jgi:type I restriction enzyme, R subunit
MSQSEQELEQNLIGRLTRLGYEPVKISNAAELTANLKTQLEKQTTPNSAPKNSTLP